MIYLLLNQLLYRYNHPKFTLFIGQNIVILTDKLDGYEFLKLLLEFK